MEIINNDNTFKNKIYRDKYQFIKLNKNLINIHKSRNGIAAIVEKLVTPTDTVGSASGT